MGKISPCVFNFFFFVTILETFFFDKKSTNDRLIEGKYRNLYRMGKFNAIYYREGV